MAIIKGRNKNISSRITKYICSRSDGKNFGTINSYQSALGEQSGGGGGVVDPAVTAGALAVYDWIHEGEINGYSDFSNMSGLTDLTENGNDVVSTQGTPQWRTNGLSGGVPATINFDNANAGFILPAAVINACVATDSPECFIVTKCNASVSSNNIATLGDAGGGDYFPYTDGNYYTSWGGSGRSTIPQDGIDNPSVVNMFFDPTAGVNSGTGAHRLSINNNAFAPTGNGSRGLLSNMNSPVRGTIGYSLSRAGGTTAYFRGSISYFAIFDRNLTTEERTEIYNYLVDRFNL